MRPGLWVRAGQTGVICGLDWTAVRSLVPPGSDVERVLALAGAIEEGMLQGTGETAKDDAARAKAREEMEALTPPPKP